MKGYLTVFLSLSLTFLLSIFLGLIGGALHNLGKMRLECAADIGANSLLGEFHRELLEQYDLLFVDLSYGTGSGGIENMEEHLKDYMEKNIHTPNQEKTTWNEPVLKQVIIPEYILASDYEGMILQRQACAYMRESGREDQFADLKRAISTAIELDGYDGMVKWNEVMSGISAIALPLVLNSQGQWEEVPLDNPAESVYATANEQLESLYYIGGKASTGAIINADSYLSHRNKEKGKESSAPDANESDRYLFQAYLFEKCGYYQQKKPGALLEYQIEYLVFGEDSDQKNIMAAAQKIFKWRFADHIRLYFGNDSKYSEAEEIAGSLRAVQLKPELMEPVTHSILYAWAFIDSIYDTGVIMQGGQVPLTKGEIDYAGAGLSYAQYLWLMLSCEEEKNIDFRAMDIMEMDIRQTAYNQDFQMDWCLESYRLRAVADGMGRQYEIDRKYGYY